MCLTFIFLCNKVKQEFMSLFLIARIMQCMFPYNFDHKHEPFSVLFGAKTPTELISVFVLLHCQNSSAVSCAKARYEGFEQTYACTHKICPSLSYFLKHAQTHTVHLLSQTHISKNTHTYSLVIYSLCCVRVCWLTGFSLNALCICVHAEETWAYMST